MTNRSKAIATPKPGNILDAKMRPGETSERATARLALRPRVQSAVTIRDYTASKFISVDLQSLVDELGEQAEAVHGGDLKRAEETLVAQAHTLDSIFNFLARRAMPNFGEFTSAAETYLRLALKAQTQCRATLETLAVIKNPTSPMFVKQANIAGGHQQVNNGLALSRAREMQSEPNELSGTSNALLQDSGAQALTSGIDSSVGALEEVQRPENSGR